MKSYPKLTEEILNEIFPKKEFTKSIKLITANNETVQVISVQGKPIFFLVKDVFLPTVFLLWKVPNLLTEFTVHKIVLTYISNGADLMIPGLANLPQQSFAANTPGYINCTDNKAALAVGLTIVGSNEVTPNAKGKCLAVYHFYGDRLCSLDNYKFEPIPDMPPPNLYATRTFAEEFPALGETVKHKDKRQNIQEDIPQSPENVAEKLENLNTENPGTSDNTESISVEQSDTSENMDDVLFRSFMIVLKYSKTSLPILTSNFYKQMTVSIPDKVVDVKKSSYKKIGQFLQKMCEVRILSMKFVLGQLLVLILCNNLLHCFIVYFKS